MRPTLFLLALLALPVCAEPYPNTGHFGVPFSEDEAWYQQCMRVRGAHTPQTDLAGDAPGSCNAENLYYDTLALKRPRPAGWAAVHACALRQTNHKILMMLYANGYGVAQHTDLAIKHACMLDNVAKAEMEGRIAHLAAGPGAKRFDFCDDITSGFAGTACTAIKERQRERGRGAALKKHFSSMPAQARPVFKQLELAAGAYAAAMESDMQGTLAPALHMRQQGRELQAFQADVAGMAKRDLPACTPGQYSQLAAELEGVMQQLVSKPSNDADHPERIGSSTISHDEIAAAQRAWLAYRDAWATFLKAAGATDRHPILASMTKRRIKHLSRILRY